MQTTVVFSANLQKLVRVPKTFAALVAKAGFKGYADNGDTFYVSTCTNL